ncbi:MULTISPECIES: RNA polymerase sigma factor [unclassified Nocardioides]|uniref:RNA polymerase sigma factor n=1 Tax=unclassified Nocardioides TaxID=2615069 RepID=UPI0036175D1F
MSEVAVESTAPPGRYATDEELFHALYPGLRRFAAVVGARDQEPDDLVQEALARALKHGPLHRLDSPGGYLRRAILNLAADTWRAAGRRERALRLLHRDAESSDPEPSDLSELDRLGSLDRAVLYLADVEGYGFREVADLLDLSGTAARSRASRARHRLRDAITSPEGDGA